MALRRGRPAARLAVPLAVIAAGAMFPAAASAAPAADDGYGHHRCEAVDTTSREWGEFLGVIVDDDVFVGTRHGHDDHGDHHGDDHGTRGDDHGDDHGDHYGDDHGSRGDDHGDHYGDDHGDHHGDGREHDDGDSHGDDRGDSHRAYALLHDHEEGSGHDHGKNGHDGKSDDHGRDWVRWHKLWDKGIKGTPCDIDLSLKSDHKLRVAVITTHEKLFETHCRIEHKPLRLKCHDHWKQIEGKTFEGPR
ncbi:hypothetical protein [Streptomyces sp. SAJ15]|uniref:hypothetical protein n=1 Tax=Streptomyces sp. SAJ15 TaxID=2011095 RepID=UPI00135E3FB0|nr:hypothetical protein [Streptomyces sp. SAJ15]TVL93578.1 hypothetical protein CD790_00440 [Streptomyces sp. SAJ15]